MKSKKYAPRECQICGKIYIPGRIDQKTCASPECTRERHRQYAIKHKTGEVRDRKCEYMRRQRAPQLYETKPDTIVAIGYADRQREQTLQMVGKVKVTL